MIIYKDATGVYVATKAEAKHMGKGWEQVEVPTTDGRVALCDWLNARPSTTTINVINPMEGEPTRDEIINSNSPEAQAEAKRLMNPSHLDQSIAFDEAWEGLPLAQKLHFAALAMEAAREELK